MDIDNGPRHYLVETMNTITGLTREMVGLPLYKHLIDAALGFPAAENTHRYQDAHKTLYGYLVDGIDKKCLAKLAAHSGRPANFESDNTIAGVKKLLPELVAPSKFAQAMSLVSDQRRLAAHSVRPRAERFPAFSTFTSDLVLCLEALKDLLGALETLLGADGELALHRDEAKSRLPRIHEQVNKFASIHRAQQMKGKTIENVEYGIREDIERVHGSEVLIVHFADGTILGIDTGSNAFNIASGRDDLRAEDFRTDFMLTWVPALGAPGTTKGHRDGGES